MMTMLKKEKTRKLYALGAKLGILESGNTNDMLHTLVYSLTQKESIKTLNEAEYRLVLNELLNMLKQTKNEGLKVRHSEGGKGMMSDGQKRKVWRLMYQLKEMDEKPSDSRLGDRLCGIIRKEIKIDCTAKQPFRWLTYRQGVKLIEILKNYVENAQRRKDGVRTET